MKSDERYYEVAGARSVAEGLLIRARARIYRDFVRLCQPGPQTTILDVGVSSVINDGANLIERHYPHRGQITAAGIGPGEGFVDTYGVGAYVRIEPNARLPFPDKSFDVATSNAVIEHVGSEANQQAFVDELSRVARQVFITAPNRYFPVEHHTAVPFLHYWRPSFVVACRVLRKTEWLNQDQLILVGRRNLERLQLEADIGHTGVMLGPFSSNLYMHFLS